LLAFYFVAERLCAAPEEEKEGGEDNDADCADDDAGDSAGG
jgi:hypothetical protein